MTIIIGLTGGIASGKSTVSRMCSELDIPVVDADIEARLAVESGEPAYNEIVKAFGSKVLLADGGIDRAALGAVVFKDEEKRLLLNSIVHPQVRKRMTEKKEALLKNQPDFIILDIPLLFESKLEFMADKTIVVYVDRDVQVSRLMERNSFSREEAEARILSQMPLAEKASLGDAVIDNNGSLEETRQQLLSILKGWAEQAELE